MRRAWPRLLESAHPSRGHLQPDWSEGLILSDVKPAPPRKLERGKEARRQARTAELWILGRRKEALEEGPVERRADHLPHPLDRLVERHHRTSMNDVHRRLGPRADHAIGRKQVEIADLPRGIAHQPQPFRLTAD